MGTLLSAGTQGYPTRTKLSWCRCYSDPNFLGGGRKFAWVARVLSLQRSAKSARSGKRVGCTKFATPSPQKGNSQTGLKGTLAMSSTKPLISMCLLSLPSPPPPPARPSSPWDVVRHGESMVPPHKVWTHNLTPSHTHEDFQPLSCRPLKFCRLAWHKWFFGLQSPSEYAHYATYWSDKPPPHTCSHCLRFHNLSVHGHLAHCAESQPVVQAWLSAWSPRAGAASWGRMAHCGDLRIAGRLAFPRSLYRHLARTPGSFRAARKEIASYQDRVLDSFTAALASAIPPKSKRPDVFVSADCDSPTPLL